MKAIVLAAGKGTRLQSEAFNAPKVLRKANGRPLIDYVLENISFIPKNDTVLVVGYKKEMVKEAVGEDYVYAEQLEQKGTGHAVMMAADAFKDYDGDVIVLYGDMPMFKKSTYENLIAKHKESGAPCTVLTGITDVKMAYGRVIRDENGNFAKVIEDKDCTEEQKKINELNVGVYVFKAKELFENLGKLKNNNKQGEYYLTDIPAILLEQGEKVAVYSICSDTEILGVNTPEDLELCEKLLKE